jgi:hypothetical protein
MFEPRWMTWSEWIDKNSCQQRYRWTQIMFNIVQYRTNNLKSFLEIVSKPILWSSNDTFFSFFCSKELKLCLKKVLHKSVCSSFIQNRKWGKHINRRYIKYCVVYVQWDIICESMEQMLILHNSIFSKRNGFCHLHEIEQC